MARVWVGHGHVEASATVSTHASCSSSSPTPAATVREEQQVFMRAWPITTHIARHCALPRRPRLAAPDAPRRAAQRSAPHHGHRPSHAARARLQAAEEACDIAGVRSSKHVRCSSTPHCRGADGGQQGSSVASGWCRCCSWFGCGSGTRRARGARGGRVRKVDCGVEKQWGYCGWGTAAPVVAVVAVTAAAAGEPRGGRRAVGAGVPCVLGPRFGGQHGHDPALPASVSQRMRYAMAEAAGHSGHVPHVQDPGVPVTWWGYAVPLVSTLRHGGVYGSEAAVACRSGSALLLLREVF